MSEISFHLLENVDTQPTSVEDKAYIEDVTARILNCDESQLPSLLIELAKDVKEDKYRIYILSAVSHERLIKVLGAPWKVTTFWEQVPNTDKN